MVVVAVSAGYCQDERALECWLLAQLTAENRAVDVRQAQVHEHHFGSKASRRIQAGLPVDGELR